MMKGPGGRALQFTFWPLEETRWPWPSFSPPPARLMTHRVGPGLPASRTLLNPVTMRCGAIASAHTPKKWREKKAIACQDGWNLNATWGQRDVGDFYPKAQRVSPGTAQNNPLWQFERKTGRTRIKIKENGTRWANGRWAAGAVLHANGSRSGVCFFFILRCVGSGAQLPFREAQLNVPVCRNVHKGSFMYPKSF